MTKNEAVGLFTSLNQLGNLKGVKFAYGVSRNISLLKPEVESLEKSLTASDEYKEFEEKRIKLVESFSKKDEKGKFVKENNNYVIEEGKQEELDKEFEVLKGENQEVFDARVKQVEEYNELLKSESEVKLYKINLSDVPVDISVKQMHNISAIIEDAVPSPYPIK